jgi:tRNA threonylcarbamoyl adenosine modification protein YeaZ
MLLVLDTCFNACSAALYDDAADRVVISDYEEMERGHAEALGPMVEQLFHEAGLKPAQLTRIAVTYGPGTFTGLRIGLSFAKGMALALNVPLVGIDSLTATAVPHPGPGGKLVVAHQAGGTGLFYWAGFENGEMSLPALGTAADIATATGHDGILLKNARLDAKDFAAYAAHLPDVDKIVQPLYLRPPDAKPSVSVEAASAQTRLANADDVSALADIHAASFAMGWTAMDLGSSLAIPGAAAVVVELSGTIYGFVQFQWVAGEAEINTICVQPNYRRQHFGRDLMLGLIRQLEAMNTTKLFLEVAENNVAARGLYESFGFQVNGVRKGYYADGQNAVTMVREMMV